MLTSLRCSVQVKIQAVKETILLMLNGEDCSELTMDIIRHATLGPFSRFPPSPSCV